MSREEYNSCVELYSDKLYRFMLSSCKDSDLARDFVQEAFEQLWLRHEQVLFEKGKSYLFSTGYHKFIDETRKAKKRGQLSEVNYNSLVNHNSYSDLQEVLHKALEKLPADQKAVILLRDYEGYSYSEIEKITGLKEAQVKVYIYRARVFLKKYIGSPEAVI